MRVTTLINVACLALLIAGCSGDSANDSSSRPAGVSYSATNDLETALKLYQSGNKPAALKVIREVLIADPQNKHAWAIAIDIHTSLGDHCKAAEMAEELSNVDQDNANKLLVRAFDWNLKCGNFVAAESNLMSAIDAKPTDPTPRRLLAQILNAQGRRQRASEQVRELLRLRSASHHEVLSLIDQSGPFLLASFDQFASMQQTTLFKLGEARMRYIGFNESPEKILEMLGPLLKSFPTDASLCAFYARVLADTGRVQQWQELTDQFPAGIDLQSEYWRSLGDILVIQQKHAEAIRAFGEAIRIDPTDRQSLRLLVQSLDVLGKAKEAEKPRKVLDDLDQIFRIAKDADADQAMSISKKLQELLRPWEAEAWRIHSAKLNGSIDVAIAESGQRVAAIAAWEQKSQPERIRDAALQKMLGFDIRQWPMPDIQLAKKSVPINLSPDAQLVKDFRFDDIVKSVGIDTKFHSGLDPDSGVFFAHQVNGGGMAAIDYDLDGRCDLYIAQAGGPPNDPTGSTANQLYRLNADGKFADVTQATQTGDRGYGQGVCVGDVNQDGFQDIIVANIGKNVVYINQGDGTFVDASNRLLDNGDRWTSSIGLADLNGDHLPEMIEINYIDDPESFRVRCDADYLPCQPQRFNTALDRIHLANVDGTFGTWSQFDSHNLHPKLGFGLVIANFHRQFGNDFFVSNDGDLNHFWASKDAASPSSGPFEIVESAGIRGCSVGRGGNSQACMGIAFGDFNRDTTLDLHVTNFHKESVNLFLQSKAGYFSDEAVKYGLYEPSFGVLGFGTQSADFDNDGWLDLAVLNGHVFDPRDPNIPYRMRSQLFAGSQSGFKLYEPDTAGAYWQTEQLGRTLVMLDWNRDGRIDLLANHLDSPVALLQNNSPIMNWVQFELVGVLSERDAIGAEMKVTAGDQVWTNWQIGGDGYMCTNEPIIHFGLGDTAGIDEVQVTWPSGGKQTFRNVEINRRWLVVESDDALTPRY
jgi:tetratricopeptide (TPR) repeat protein